MILRNYWLLLIVIAVIVFIIIKAFNRGRKTKFSYYYHSLMISIILLHLFKGPPPLNTLIGPSDSQGGFANLFIYLWIYISIYLSYLFFLLSTLIFSKYLESKTFIFHLGLALVLQGIIFFLVYLTLSKNSTW
jgi:hypothetical protein